MMSDEERVDPPAHNISEDESFEESDDEIIPGTDAVIILKCICIPTYKYKFYYIFYSKLEINSLTQYRVD